MVSSQIFVAIRDVTITMKTMNTIPMIYNILISIQKRNVRLTAYKQVTYVCHSCK